MAAVSGDVSDLDELYTPTAAGSSPATAARSREELVAEIEERRGALSHEHVTFGRVESNGSVVRLEWEASALHTGPLPLPGTGAVLEPTGLEAPDPGGHLGPLRGSTDRLVAGPLGGRRPGVMRQRAPVARWYPVGYHGAVDAAVTLRRVRLRSGLSLRALAARADTSHSTLSAYEAGRKVPTVETLDRIVRAAGFELGVELTPAVGGADREARAASSPTCSSSPSSSRRATRRTLDFPVFPRAS